MNAKRICAVLTGLILLISILPATAMAEAREDILAGTFSGGGGGTSFDSGTFSGGGGGTSFVSKEYESFGESAQIALNAEVSVQVMKGHWEGDEYVEDHNPYTNHFQIVLPENGYIFCENDCGLKIYSPDDEEYEIACLGAWPLGLAQGTYYLKGDFTYCETGRFTIYYQPADDWEKERNDSIGQATEVPQNTPVHGWLGDDTDWFQFTLPEAGLVSFGLTYNNEQTDLDKYWFVELYDYEYEISDTFDGEPGLLDGIGGNVAEDSDPQKTIEVKNVGLPAGTYYLRPGAVSNFGAVDYNYQIFWDYTPSSFCETERNDSYETADLLPLNQPFFAERTFAQPMHAQRIDDDCFRIELESPGPVSFSVTPEKSGILGFVLEDSEKNPLFDFELSPEKYNPGDTYTSKTVGLPAGTYYLNARVEDNIPYYLTVNYEASDFWEKEPNDDYDSANVIQPGTTLHGKCRGSGGGDDCFTFTLTEPGYINTGLLFQYHEDDANKGRSFLLSLENKQTDFSLTVEGCGDDPDGKASIEKLGLPAGKYYLSVWSNTINDDVDNYYDLYYDFVPTPYYEQEPNDTEETATPIELNQDWGGRTTGWDADHYVFTVPKDGEISFSITGEADSYFFLDFPDDIEDISFGTVPAGVEAVSDPFMISAGTYSLRVEAENDVSYTFRVNYTDQPAPKYPSLQPDTYAAVSSEDGEDWYSFTPETDGQYKLLTSSSSCQPSVNVYDTRGEELYQYAAEAPENNLDCMLDLLAGNTYYLKFGANTDAFDYQAKIFSWEQRTAVTGVTLSNTSKTLAHGSTLQLKETISPAGASYVPVTWTSSDVSVATVSSSGLVKAVGCGSASIAVTTADGNKTAACKITVPHTPASAVVENKKAATCTAKGGYDKVVYCSKCGSKVSSTHVATAALGHNYKTTVRKATLTANGKITKACTRCGRQASVTTIRRIKTISLNKSSFTYKGTVQKPTVTVKDTAGKVISKSYYTVTYKTSGSKAAGTYTLTVRFKGNYSGSKTLKYTINKAANPLKIKKASASYRQTALTAAKSFSIGATKAQGKVTYTLNAAARGAKIKVTSSGKVTIPKKCKKGTFKISVKAAGNKNYKAGSKVVTIVVR